jgi:hypothetical protein
MRGTLHRPIKKYPYEAEQNQKTSDGDVRRHVLAQVFVEVI